MAAWITGDNSNLYMEAQRVSAVQRGLVADIGAAMQTDTRDKAYRLRFAALRHALVAAVGAEARAVARAVLFGSHGSADAGIWSFARAEGFETMAEERAWGRREKRVDTGLVTEMLRDAYTRAADGDTFVLAAGDGDYVPAVRALRGDGVDVRVVFWDHAAAPLKKAAAPFIPLDPHLDALRL